LTTDTTKSGNANGGDAQAAATNAIKAITRIETDFHNTLEQSYSSMSDTTFKALRRNLPITRELIQWEKIGSYKMGPSR